MSAFGGKAIDPLEFTCNNKQLRLKWRRGKAKGKDFAGGFWGVRLRAISP
jgi:hypothetical protein